MINIGRVCVKTAGRDSGKKCVIVDVIDNNTVLVDGQTRRKKCSIRHIEPLNKVVEVGRGASHEEIVNALKDAGIDVSDKK